MNMHQKVRKSPTILPSAGEINAMVRKGMTQTEIASIFGVTTSAINVKLRRAGFAAIRNYGGNRVTTKHPPDVCAVIMEKYPAPPTVKHTDRVTRITPTGMRISLPRVTFIDGPAP